MILANWKDKSGSKNSVVDRRLKTTIPDLMRSILAKSTRSTYSICPLRPIPDPFCQNEYKTPKSKVR